MRRFRIKRVLLSLLALLALVVLLPLSALFWLAFSEGPSATVTDRLAAMRPADAELLLVKKVSSLNKWIWRKRLLFDSTDFYIFENVLFRDLHANPYEHLPYTKSIVTNSHVDFAIKKILLNSSQCLDLKDYLSLGELIYDIGDVNLMEAFLFPYIGYGVILDENYRDPRVVEFLDRAVKKYPTTAPSVELITSGIAFSQITAYRNFGESIPILNCPDGDR